MISALKSEVRKLTTVRSSYFIALLALALTIFFAGYAKGYRISGFELASPFILQEAATITVMITSIFVAIIGILLITHEYRYNTILYSLTAGRSRTTFFVAKVVAVTIASLLLTAAIALLAPLFTWIGIQLAGHSLPTQSFAFGETTWRILFYGWGNAMIALLFGVLIRNQIGAIVAFFVIPSTVETILTLLLKEDAKYLPFRALGTVIDKSPDLSYGASAAVFTVYLVVLSIVAWLLLLRRDAN